MITMKRLTGVFCLAILGLSAWPQSVLQWSRDLDGGAIRPEIEVINDTINVVGPVNTQFGQRLDIIKYDLAGNLVSTMIYGGDSVAANQVVDHKFQGDSVLFILQNDHLEYYKSKIVVQKYTLDGVLVWVAQMQSPADTSFTPVSMALINDTSILVTGYREYDYPAPGDDFIQTVTTPFAAMFTTEGQFMWGRDFDPVQDIEFFTHEIIPVNGTGLIFGMNYSISPCLVRLDAFNSMELHTHIDVPDRVGPVEVLPDSNLLVCSRWKYKVTKLGLEGDSLWATYYGTNLPSNVTGDDISALVQGEDGTFYVTGRHVGVGTNADILTLKYDSLGNLLWQNRYEYGGNNADIGICMVLKNGFLYVGGESQRLGISTDYDYVLLKIDAASGETTGTYRYNGVADGDDGIYSISVLDDGRVALTGRSDLGPSYGWTTQLLSDVVLSLDEAESNGGFNVYPVPVASGQVLTVSGSTAGEYSLLSQTGQLIQAGKLRPGEERIQLPELASGVYLIRLWNENSSRARRLIVR